MYYQAVDPGQIQAAKTGVMAQCTANHDHNQTTIR